MGEAPFHRTNVCQASSEFTRGHGMALRGQIRRIPLLSRQKYRRGDALVKERKSLHGSISGYCESLRETPADTLVDGEVVAVDESGRISFNLLQHHRSKAQALLFYVFDVLIYRGRSLFKLTLEKRREVLANIFKSDRSGASPVFLSENIEASPSDLV